MVPKAIRPSTSKKIQPLFVHALPRQPFSPSPDPMLEELQAIVAPLEVGLKEQDYACLRQLYSRKDVFGLDLYEAGLGAQIEGMVKELFAGKGAVRATLHKYVSAR